MKKTIITTGLLSIILLSGALAQKKGDNLVGINLGFGKSKSESSSFINESELKSFQYGVGYTYFFKENRGLRINYTSFNADSESNSDGDFYSTYENKTNIYKVDYYALFPLSKTFFISVIPGVLYQNSKFESFDESFDVNQIDKNRSTIINLSTGLFWLPLKKLGLSVDLSLANLTFQKTKRNASSTNPQFEPQESTFRSYYFNLATQNNSQNQAITIFYKF